MGQKSWEGLQNLPAQCHSHTSEMAMLFNPRCLGVAQVVGKDWRWITVKQIVAAVLLVILSLTSTGCGDRATTRKSAPVESAGLVGRLTEVAPPDTIQSLKQALEGYQPQVKILNPGANEVIKDDRVSVRLQVTDLPLFQDESLGLGPHLHVFLDNQPYKAVYNATEPLTFENLTPGTHTIRAFASRPWHESFKNEGAFAQTTFHVYTKTPDNLPDRDRPLLTYSRPQGSYGAEPVLLDFYLTNAPLHLIAQERADDDVKDWKIRCTVNGESFTFNTWEPIYLKGLKPGKNWVQLELLDEDNNPISNTFNNTVRVITYKPGGDDTLSKLVRGDLPEVKARRIVDPNYVEPPVTEILPEVTPEPDASPIPTLSPEPGIPKPAESIEPEPLPTPAVKEMPVEPVLIEPASEEPVRIESPPEPTSEETTDEVEESMDEELTIAPSSEGKDAEVKDSKVNDAEPVKSPLLDELEAEPAPAIAPEGELLRTAPTPQPTPSKIKGFFNRFRQRSTPSPAPVIIPEGEMLRIAPEPVSVETQEPQKSLPEVKVEESDQVIPNDQSTSIAPTEAEKPFPNFEEVPLTPSVTVEAAPAEIPANDMDETDSRPDPTFQGTSDKTPSSAPTSSFKVSPVKQFFDRLRRPTPSRQPLTSPQPVLVPPEIPEVIDIPEPTLDVPKPTTDPQLFEKAGTLSP